MLNILLLIKHIKKSDILINNKQLLTTKNIMHAAVKSLIENEL